MIAIRYMKFQFRAHFLSQLKSFLIAIVCMLVSFLTHNISEAFRVPVIAEVFMQAVILSITWLTLVIVIKHEIVNSIYQTIKDVRFFNSFLFLKVLSTRIRNEK